MILWARLIPSEGRHAAVGGIAEALDSGRPEFESCHFHLLAGELSASPQLSEPQFLHLQNGDNSMVLMELL